MREKPVREEIQAARLLRIKVITVQPGDSVESLSHRMMGVDRPAERFRVLNGLEAHAGEGSGEDCGGLIQAPSFQGAPAARAPISAQTPKQLAALMEEKKIEPIQTAALKYGQPLFLEDQKYLGRPKTA